MRNGSSSYSFDQIGNRTTVSVPEEPNPIAYVSNALNQYTSVDFVSSVRSPQYDGDGNMTDNGDGKTHTWTGENRLEVFTQGDITVESTYDGQGRRVRKLVKDLGVVTQDLRYMYDGWNLLYEIDMHATGTPSRRYVWGLDLSQSMRGAGGVGGLLFTEADSISHALTYDANGNVSEYIDLADGSITAHLEYDAFGRTIASTGTAPAPFGFSTKYQDDESGYYYYGYRFYDADNGRWPNRDPIEEEGGYNLYGFVENDGVNSLDNLGLDMVSFCREGTDKVFWDITKKPSGDYPQVSDVVRSIAFGTVDESGIITISGEYGGGTIGILDAAILAQNIHSRFGYYDTFSEEAHKSVVKLALKYRTEPENFDSVDEAAIYAGWLVHGKSSNHGGGLEWGIRIYKKNGVISIGNIRTSGYTNQIFMQSLFYDELPQTSQTADNRIIGALHNHPSGTASFSGGDIGYHLMMWTIAVGDSASGLTPLPNPEFNSYVFAAGVIIKASGGEVSYEESQGNVKISP